MRGSKLDALASKRMRVAQATPRGLAWIAGLALLLGSPRVHAVGPAREAAPAGEVARVGSLAVRAPAGLEWKAAAALRLPDRELWAIEAQAPTAAQSQGALRGFVEFSRVEGSADWQLLLILADGRAFVRRVPDPGDDPARALVSSLENLLAGVERGELAADEQDVELPAEATVEANEPAAPDPKETDATGTTGTTVEAEEKPPAAPPPDRVHYPRALLWFEGQGILGFVAPAWRGGAGALGFDYRFDRGAMLRGGLRVAGTRNPELGLFRMRVSVGGGYSWRRGNFELPVIATINVEPWLALVDGRPQTPLRPGNQSSVRAPLVGMSVALEPRWHLSLWGVGRKGRLSALSLGVRAELGASYLLPEFTAVSVRRDADSDAPLLLGGPELALGLTLGLAFAPR